MVARILSLLLLAVSLSFSQEALTNDAIVKLVKAGMSESLILTMINQQPGNYATKVDDLIALKQAGVSDKIVVAMAAKSAGVSASVPAVTGAPAAPPANPTMEIGVYFKRAGAWVEVLPEVVNWKQGGTLKSLATVGIVKKDVNGNIPGPHSRNTVSGTLEFMIVAPEGVAITEYQLLRLRPNKDYREFRTITGGIMNQQSGSMRDMVPFEGKKLSPRTFSIVLPGTLGAGEYGFLSPGAFGSSGNSAAQIGKMYSFRIVD